MDRAPSEDDRRQALRYWRQWVLAGAMIGAVMGPLVLTQIAYWHHQRRYLTASEFWTWVVTVPIGFASGTALGAILVEQTARYRFGLGLAPWVKRIPGLPLTGWWLWLLLIPVCFVAAHLGLYALMLRVLPWLGIDL